MDPLTVPSVSDVSPQTVAIPVVDPSAARSGARQPRFRHIGKRCGTRKEVCYHPAKEHLPRCPQTRTLSFNSIPAAIRPRPLEPPVSREALSLCMPPAVENGWKSKRKDAARAAGRGNPLDCSREFAVSGYLPEAQFRARPERVSGCEPGTGRRPGRGARPLQFHV